MTITEMEHYAKSLGSVFKKFPDQDSGNVCFSIRTEEKPVWIKFLNLEKIGIDDLQEVIDFYNSCNSPLIAKHWKLYEVNGTYVMQCDWVPGTVLNSPGEDRNYGNSAYRRFMNLPFEKRAEVCNSILCFFEWLESENIIIEDFYDGCIIYDFDNNDTYLCDLDHLHHGPYVLEKERQYGSTRFMAPEEIKKGSLIDFTTNVYTMGATGFVLLNDNYRNRNEWPHNSRVYDLLIRAVSEDRRLRFQSIKEMNSAWKDIFSNM
ncbi:MAG: serine/threonine protein kinase [Spirochaetales bacterium]|nr:serine/threonine protein kinase [Spirochaetales bacterium]